MKAALGDFLEHLRLNENASRHTVRAYDSDLSQFLTFLAARAGRTRAELTMADFDSRRTSASSWATCTAAGNTRSSAARKLAAIRTFGRYLRREGLLDGDPAALVGTPKREQRLPAHLGEAEMSTLLDMPDASQPLGRRDRAILELFYASGLRLSELVGLDLGDVNLNGRMVRVLGKGRQGADRAVQPLHGGRAARLAERPRVAVAVAETPKTDGTRTTRITQRQRHEDRRSPDRGITGRGARGRRSSSTIRADGCQRAASTGWSGSMWPPAARASGSARTRCGTRLRRTCSNAAPTCARFRSCSATPA